MWMRGWWWREEEKAKEEDASCYRCWPERESRGRDRELHLEIKRTVEWTIIGFSKPLIQ